MKLVRLRLRNFQSFGPDTTEIDLEDMTFLLGPNGSGKTAVLQALARMFGVDPAQRRMQRQDFHIPVGEDQDNIPETRELYLEADFEFPELEEDDDEEHPTIPGHFSHMQLESAEGPSVVRFRLDATLDSNFEVEEELSYVIGVDKAGNPLEKSKVSKQDRGQIQIHYLPARRDPADHVSYTANALLGRLLRSADWTAEQKKVNELTSEISTALASNLAVTGLGQALEVNWNDLHKGTYYSNPSLSFDRGEIDSVLRHLTIRFAPGASESVVDFSRLSDGQQSMLYLTLVLAAQDIGRKVLSGEIDGFDIDKLRPAVFTMIAMEEPENSLSPHLLGRVVNLLEDCADNDDAQAIIATHAPAMLKRIEPANVRYLRLNEDRETLVRTIVMPDEGDEAFKFVRQAVQAFPELYFSRLVILGEGDSEEIVLPRLLEARDILYDDASVSVVPLGERHVNHFWRLLRGLRIPYVTLLDFDLARYHGGWGRIRYAAKQLIAFNPKCGITQAEIDAIPKWDANYGVLHDADDWVERLEGLGVYFSHKLDLDFMMLRSFPGAYGVEDKNLVVPDEKTVAAVLGKSHDESQQYADEERSYFDAYHRRFILGSKPTWHLQALAELDDEQLVEGMPTVLVEMIDHIEEVLSKLPE